jgi:hypothetical protein
MLKGVNGQIKWSYHVAADIKGYTVSRNATTKEWSMRGTAVQADAFKLAQRPLVFVAPHQGGEWRWPIESVQVDGGTVTASLGPPLT